MARDIASGDGCVAMVAVAPALRRNRGCSYP